MRTPGFWNVLSAWCRLLVASAAPRRFTRAARVVKSTRWPRWHWAYPSARARCVFPRPGSPTKSAPIPSATRSVASRFRYRRRSCRVAALYSKSKVSTVCTWTNFAAWLRAAIARSVRRASSWSTRASRTARTAACCPGGRGVGLQPLLHVVAPHDGLGEERRERGLDLGGAVHRGEEQQVIQFGAERAGAGAGERGILPGGRAQR